MLRRRCGSLLKSLAARRSLLPNTGTSSGSAALRGDASASESSTLFARAFGSRILSNGLLKPEVLSRTAPSKVFASTFVSTTKSFVSGGPVAQKQVSTWLYICTGWVFGMVVLGGMTRLTRSGLSMTDWKFTGSLPPMSAEDWSKEFDKYKQSPEYRTVNRGMSLEEFKFIYWMEYAHRMSGRGLGIAFALPLAYFSAKGYMTLKLASRLGLLFVMGAGQGFVGWWMVRSGLEEPVTEGVQARVSPYRLATHLVSAFVIYSGLLWTALSVSSPQPLSQHSPQIVLQASRRLRSMVHPLLGLVGLTALSGAFVAGNDAGRAYNTFPKMGGHWIPEGLLELEPVTRNFFENTATVQFDHRILATTTLLSVGALFWASRGLSLLPGTNKLVKGALHMTVLQVSLGIYALLSYVPVSVGVAHQAGALTLFTIMLALAHSIKRPAAAVTETTKLVNRLKLL